MHRPDDSSGSFLAPALLTGTSAEFLGRKPLPRLLQERRVLFVLGPDGVGKTTVARSLCAEPREELDKHQLESALVERVRGGAWHPRLLEVGALLVDGPIWLRHRHAAVSLLLELARLRADGGLRTAFCQAESDGSIEELITQCEPGFAVVVGLRFPTGKRSRLRTARQLCADLGLPAAAADGTEELDPWRYDHLVAYLIERAWPPGPPVAGPPDGSPGSEDDE